MRRSVEVGASGHGGLDQLLERGRDRVGVLPGRKAHGHVGDARTGSTVFSRCGEPASMPLTSSAGSAVVRI